MSPHHGVEAIFKGLARALARWDRSARRRVPR
jgi:imidazoleglycerol phosphate dehydratase HisB